MMSSSENPNWLSDCPLVNDIPVAVGDLAVPAGGFYWAPQGFDGPTDPRPKMESCATGSKACREKLRRDKLNDRFLELGTILEPGKPPKMDKAAILSDAVRLVSQLRGEAQKLRIKRESSRKD